MPSIQEIIQLNEENYDDRYFPINREEDSLVQQASSTQSFSNTLTFTCDNIAREFNQMVTNVASTHNQMCLFLDLEELTDSKKNAHKYLTLASNLCFRIGRVPFFSDLLVRKVVLESGVYSTVNDIEAVQDSIVNIEDFIRELHDESTAMTHKLDEFSKAFKSQLFISKVFLNTEIEKASDSSRAEPPDDDPDWIERVNHAYALYHFSPLFTETMEYIYGVSKNIHSKLNDVQSLLQKITLALSSVKEIINKSMAATTYSFDIYPTQSFDADMGNLSRKLDKGALDVLVFMNVFTKHYDEIELNNHLLTSKSFQLDSIINDFGGYVEAHISPLIVNNIVKVSNESMLQTQRDYDSEQEKY